MPPFPYFYLPDLFLDSSKRPFIHHWFDDFLLLSKCHEEKKRCYLWVVKLFDNIIFLCCFKFKTNSKFALPILTTISVKQRNSLQWNLKFIVGSGEQLTLKSLIQEQTRISKQADIFWKNYKQAGLNKQAGWEVF